jgi:RecG-like helicase
MGAGKTIVALTAMQELLRDGVVKRALVFAPPNVVADVWPGEYLTWDHTACLNIAIANGSPGSRKELVADLSNEIIVL